MTVRILVGDAREVIRTLPDESVHCVVTSPPYFGLRDYGTGTWAGGDPQCSHVIGEMRRGLGLAASPAATRGGAIKCAEVQDIRARARCPHCGAVRTDQQMGLEETPEAYVAALVELFREVWRVLRPDATVWLNLGDSYAAGGNGGHTMPGPPSAKSTLQGNGHIGGGPKLEKLNRKTPQFHGHTDRGIAERVGIARRAPSGLKPKDLLMIPARVALALQADGWLLRQEIVWVKPNPMPESVRDRCTKAHESIFLLAKGRRYYFDAAAIAEPVSPDTHLRVARGGDGSARANGGTRADRPMQAVVSAKTKAAGARVKNNESFSDAISGGQVTERNKRDVWTVGSQPFTGDLCTACGRYYPEGAPRARRLVDGKRRQVKGCRCGETESWVAHFATFPPALVEPCVLAGCPKGGVVLDPFGGAGTVGVVADRLGRDALLIELNPHYAEMARQRLAGDAGMFAEVDAA